MSRPNTCSVPRYYANVPRDADRQAPKSRIEGQNEQNEYECFSALSADGKQIDGTRSSPNATALRVTLLALLRLAPNKETRAESRNVGNLGFGHSLSLRLFILPALHA